MIEIKKGKEPSALIAYRKTQYATYDDMPKAVHDAVLDSLMQEQGYLCAYCMCRIPQKGKTPSATVEHWDPQSRTCTDKALDYRNMFAVCNGNRGCGSKEYMTCDAKRGNTPLTVHPLNPLTLSSIQYKSDGRIFSLDPDINTDLDDTLNLNCSQIGLVESRRRALQVLQSELKKKHPTGDITSSCLKLLQKYQSQPAKTPYLGILIWWLQRHIRKKRGCLPAWESKP